MKRVIGAAIFAVLIVVMTACGSSAKTTQGIYEITPMQAGDSTCYVLTWTGRPYDVNGFSCVRNEG